VCKTVTPFDICISAEHMLTLHSIIFSPQFSCQETSLLTIKHLHNLAFQFCFLIFLHHPPRISQTNILWWDVCDIKIPHPILNVTLEVKYKTPN